METKVNHLQWKIGGEAGFGIKITGQMFARMCLRAGLHVFDYTEYPSLIRGGHNAYQVLASDQPVHAPVVPVDLLVALNQETVTLHHDELAAGAGLVYDVEQSDLSVEGLQSHGVLLFPVPLVKLAKEAGGNPLMRNVVALGVSAALVQLDPQYLSGVIDTAFRRKGESVLQANQKAANAGYAYAQQHFSKMFSHSLAPIQNDPRIVITGNTAIALGAIQAGCTYYAAYPMTPSTSILSFLAKHAEKIGMVVRHAEDEIAVINSAIGAAYAGARAMVGTAGGGFALMVEGFGLAGMVEVPVVVVVGQRPGPATGLPTWTGQADFQFILHAAQDEFPRIIIAPGDVNECFSETFQAFNLAERYQTPVVVLTDKLLGESHMSVPPFATKHLRYDRGEVVHQPQPDANGFFPRYHATDSGVSPRTLPGTPGGVHVANSDEHDAYGFVDETAANRRTMMEKRMRKLQTVLKDIPMPTLYGPRQADCTIVSWGSTKGAILDALPVLQAQGLRVNFLHFLYLHPLPIERLVPLFRSIQMTLVVENNATAQFAQHLKEQIGLLPEATLLKYDGRPFFPSEIVAKVHSIMRT